MAWLSLWQARWTPDHYSSHIVLLCENEFKIIQRPPTYVDALNAIYTHFPSVGPGGPVKLLASSDSTWPDEGWTPSLATSDTWRFIGPTMSILLAEVDPGSRPRVDMQQSRGASKMIPNAPTPIQLTAVRPDQTTFTLFVSSKTLVSQLFELVDTHDPRKKGIGLRVFAGLAELGPWCRETLEDAGVENGGLLLIDYRRLERPAVKKPVIYLFPPSPLRASVAVSLSPSWVFDVIYPPAKINNTLEVDGYPQTIQWEVDAEPGGDLVDRASGVQVSYLFWEGLVTESSSTLSSPSTTFVPGLSRCTPSDSVVLSQDNLLKYLASSLKTLGLHTEARTSFIAFWLPAFQKHRYIALRFVPQAAYEAAAPLVVDPKPDVVTRVFMLFQGVHDIEDEGWFEAVARSEEDVARWKEVVGIEEEKQADATLFRVLEWGGMEVCD